jgi:hypothetical protein
MHVFSLSASSADQYEFLFIPRSNGVCNPESTTARGTGYLAALYITDRDREADGSEFRPIKLTDRSSASIDPTRGTPSSRRIGSETKRARYVAVWSTGYVAKWDAGFHGAGFVSLKMHAYYVSSTWYACAGEIWYGGMHARTMMHAHPTHVQFQQNCSQTHGSDSSSLCMHQCIY